MKRHFYLPLFLVVLLLLGFSTKTFAARALYDDFSSKYIDGSKWTTRTYAREIVDGQFVSKLGNRSPGMDAEISPGFFSNPLEFPNPESINSIECDITIVEAVLDSAPDSESYVRIAGYFYNKNDIGGTTGDIYAAIIIGDRGNGGLEAWWYADETLSDDSNLWQILGSETIIGPGTLQYNTPYNVKISYDGTNNFSFIVNEQSDNYTGPIKKRDSVKSWKALTTAIWAENGSNDGFVSAKFDNVYINGQETVYDDFSSSPIDLSKWDSVEWVREVSNGSLRTGIQMIDSTSQVDTPLTVPNTPYVEAKVRILSDSQISLGTRGFARIQGYWYNEFRGPGSGLDYNGYEGDVFAEVRLLYGTDGTLSAEAIIGRSDGANQDPWTELFYHLFSTPIQFDTDYILSIEYANSQLIFKCNGETISYAITTPEYVPYGEHRHLRTRVYLDPGESGYMKAQYDDVYIDTGQAQAVKAMPWIPLLLLDDSGSQNCTDEICDDGIDNDCDDKIDCDDSDCAEDEICKTPMALIPSGCSNMGGGNEDELPVHEVCISGFYMDVHEVTNAEYAACVSAGGCTAPSESGSNLRHSYYGNPTYDDFPVIYVNWNQATDYCAWAGKRLPTEAEWEYAARGGLSDKRYPWGDTISGTDANYFNSGDPWDNDTSPVGYYAANGYGLYDMAGNVYEWVNDWYQSDYYSMSPVNDPPGPATGTNRVFRGGCFLYPGNLYVAYRGYTKPTYHLTHSGFRCARD